jgi:uncharacterized protein (DUF2147 family)
LSYANVLLAALVAAGAPQAGIEGDWLTADGNAIVRVAPCGVRLCGNVVRVLARGPGVPRTDVRNPDPALRSRPLVGLPVLTGFTRDGGEWTGGHAYDAKTGQSYKARLASNPDGSLTVTGCILFLCKSQTWTRVR